MVIKFFAIFLMAAVTHFGSAQTLCSNELNRIYCHAANLESEIAVTRQAEQLFICQHLAFHKFIKTFETSNAELENVMDDIIDSLCTIWVSHGRY